MSSGEKLRFACELVADVAQVAAGAASRDVEGDSVAVTAFRLVLAESLADEGRRLRVLTAALRVVRDER